MKFAQAEALGEATVPLVVDLDGALAKTDLLLEGIVRVLAGNPAIILSMLVWLCRGRAHFKYQVARRANLDVTALPYNRAVLQLVTAAKARGRLVVLATSAVESHSRAVAGHLGGFDQVFSTAGEVNLSGRAKADRLVAAYGRGGFDYVGNGHADLPVWRSARRVIVVNPEPYLQTRMRSMEVERVMDDRRPFFRSVIRQMRLHHWAKNLLVFVPAITAHRLGDGHSVIDCALAFIGLSLVASSVYILNDLIDLRNDRLHPAKRSRPLAAGDLPLAFGMLAVPILLIGGLLVAVAVSRTVAAVVALYFVITLLYSLWLKRVVILDVLTLASLYLLRVLVGSAAIRVAPSVWLLMFSIFFFLSLAMLKRYIELRAGYLSVGIPSGRGYRAGDADMVAMLGTAGGLLSVLVLALYIDTPDVTHLYSAPALLWLICGLGLYWIARTWLLAHRNELHHDPVLHALTDPVSLCLSLVAAAIILAATFL